ncbi:MAG: flagellar protein FliS [Deltaproteobacteria bacterium]|nr:flagellar protein FliS [Deltaproteobacteria bacterium]
MTRRVLQADVKRDVKGLDEVAGMLEELKEAWEEAFYGGQKDIKMGSYLSDESTGQVVSTVHG